MGRSCRAGSGHRLPEEHEPPPPSPPPAVSHSWLEPSQQESVWLSPSHQHQPPGPNSVLHQAAMPKASALMRNSHSGFKLSGRKQRWVQQAGGISALGSISGALSNAGCCSLRLMSSEGDWGCTLSGKLAAGDALAVHN